MKFSLKDLKNKKSVVLIGVIALLFIIAVWLNIATNGSKTASGKPTATLSPTASDRPVSAGANYFDSFRMDRDLVRSKELEYLNEIISDTSSDEETLAEAQQQKLSIVDSMEKEFTLESLIKAKGFEDVAVTYHKGSVNVFVDAESLSEQQVAQILDIVKRETGESAGNIKVSNG